MSNKNLSLYNLLNDSMNLFDILDRCYEIVSNNSTYGLIARIVIKHDSPKFIASDWKSLFGTEFPQIVMIEKVTNATVYEDTVKNRNYRWLVPNMIKRHNNQNIKDFRLSFKKGDNTIIDDFFIVDSDTPHLATDEELELIKKYRFYRFMPFDTIIDEETSARIYTFNQLIMVGTSAEIEEVWDSLGGSENTLSETVFKAKADRKFDNTKSLICFEDKDTSLRFVTSKKDLAQTSEDIDDAIIFTNEEANLVIKENNEIDYQLCSLNGNDDEIIRDIVYNILSSIYYKDYDDNDEEVLGYSKGYKEIISYLIERCDGTYGELLNTIKNYCDFSEYA